MGFLCRCSNHNCHVRRSLNRLPQDYIRPPKCLSCGGRQWKWDKWQERKNKETVCDCQGYYWKHRKGSKWCRYFKGKYTIEELMKHYKITDPLDIIFHPQLGIVNNEECPF